MKIGFVLTNELQTNGKLRFNQGDWKQLNQKRLNPNPKVGPIFAHFKISEWFNFFWKYENLDFPLWLQCSAIPSNNQFPEKLSKLSGELFVIAKFINFFLEVISISFINMSCCHNFKYYFSLKIVKMWKQIRSYLCRFMERKRA